MNYIKTETNVTRTTANRSVKMQRKNLKGEIWEPLDTFINKCGRENTWSAATYTKFKVMRQLLRSFAHEATFDTFNHQGLNDYVEYLRTSRGMLNSTIERQLHLLKWFLRWAVRQGLNECYDFQHFKPKLRTATRKVIFLDTAELNRLINTRIPAGKPHLERVRDIFLFSCFTGLRYSDVRNLRRSDIHDEHIEVTTVKTADSLRIQLNNQSRNILNKYRSLSLPDDRALPVHTNQCINRYIKQLGRIAGIDQPVRITTYRGNCRIDRVVPKYELLSCHAGRRTFVCMALSLGIPVNVVMKWTGHSNYKAMKPYIDIADQMMTNNMTKFDAAFS